MDFTAALADFSWLVILSIVLGMIFVILEIITPNFGILGASGIIFIVGGTAAISQIVSSTALVAIIAGILLIIALVLVISYRSATNGGVSRTLVLKTTEAKDKGYVGVSEHKSLLGKEGIALTQLRPAGTAEFDGLKVDVVTNGEFITKGTKLTVIEVESYKIVVEKSKYSI